MDDKKYNTYVVCIMNGFGRSDLEKKPRMSIRGCTNSLDEIVSFYKSNKEYTYSLHPICMFSNPDESYEEFIMRATIAGYSPQLEEILDSEYNLVDIRLFDTHQSLLALREKACET